MRFLHFLGNDAIRQRLDAAARNGRLSHCFLISGARGSGKHTLFYELAAYLQCTAAGGEKPCGVCPACRKVYRRQHPDVIVVDEEKKNIPVETVRRACTGAYTRPNEGARKIFLFPRAQALGMAGQNALLKLIEEPPAYASFFLLCENAQTMLPTIRSRCVQLNLSALERPAFDTALLRACGEIVPERRQALYEQSSGYVGQAIELLAVEQENSRAEPFAQALASHDALKLAQQLVPMERLSRDSFADVLLQWERLIGQALLAKHDLTTASEPVRIVGAACSEEELVSAAQAIRRTYEYSQSNVGVAHLCGMLEVLLARPKKDGSNNDG